MPIPLLLFKATLICFVKNRTQYVKVALQWSTVIDIFIGQYALDIDAGVTYIMYALTFWEESYVSHRNKTENLIL